MRDITDEFKVLFTSSSVHKELVIDFQDNAIAPITNDRIVSEQVTLTESINEEHQLRFGGCLASQFEITVANLTENVNNMEIYPKIVIGENIFPLGTFIVYSSKKVAGKPYKKLLAYDIMYKFDIDVKDWYAKLKFPITVKNFRNSLCKYCGVPQVEDDLIIDGIQMKKTLDTSSAINGLTLMKQICELAGVFGRINAEGKLEYKSLGTASLVPSDDLFPSDDLYPLGAEVDYEIPTHLIKNFPTTEDFLTAMITGVVITDENERDFVSGTLDNPYVIMDNFVVYNTDDDTKNSIVGSLLGKISSFSYRPVSDLKIVGQPYVECGDLVRGIINDVPVETYVMKRVLTGVQSLTDTYSSEGVEYLENDVNSLTRQLERLNRGLTNVKVQVETTATGLESKVSKGDVVSSINQEPGSVTIDAKKINLNGAITANENVKINTNGTITAKNANISGTINATNGSFTGVVNATSGSFKGTINATGGSFKGDVNATTFKSEFDYQHYRYSVATGGSRDYMLTMTSTDTDTKKTLRQTALSDGGIVLKDVQNNTQSSISYSGTITPELTTDKTSTDTLQVGGGKTITKMRGASTVLQNVSGSSAVLVSSGCTNDDVFFVTNGDGNASDVHIEGTTIKDGRCYVLFNKSVSNATIRVNYIRFTM